MSRRRKNNKRYYPKQNTPRYVNGIEKENLDTEFIHDTNLEDDTLELRKIENCIDSSEELSVEDNIENRSIMEQDNNIISSLNSKKELVSNKKFSWQRTATLVILVLLLSAPIYVLGKYISGVIGTSATYIDKIYYSVELTSSSTAELENEKTTTIYFDVHNYDKDNNLNEVLSKYYINIDTSAIAFNIAKKVYYQDGSDWNEINAETSGSYNGYYQSYENMGFNIAKTYKYKVELTTSDDIIVNDNFNVKIDLKVIQTK